MSQVPSLHLAHLPATLRGVVCAMLIAAGLNLISPTVLAQQSTPVYVDDSVVARESLARVEDLVSSKNLTEAARILQAVLDTESDRVLESPRDAELFLSVRALVHQKLLANPALLERYLLSESPRAQRALESGDLITLERTRLLTSAGFDAALRLSRSRLLEGRFEAARLALAQLDQHPDRTPARAKPAAALALDIAKYLPRAEVRAWAAQWASVAGQPAPTQADLTPVQPPARALRHTRSPMSIQDVPPVWSGDALAKPLVSTLVGTQFDTPRDDWEVALADLPQRSEERGNAWMFPSVLGDVVYTNDGVEITAYDRITLSVLWRARPPSLIYDETSYEERRGRIYRPDYILDDVSSVSVGSGVVVGVSGLAMGSSRRGDPRVHAYTIDGQWLWSADIESISPQFESATVRGEILIDGDTVIVPVRKRATSRRISSAYLVALDLYTGQVKWTRLLGSAGSLPSAARDRIADSPLLYQGLVIHTDGLGVVAAIESATGRIAWSRRFRGEPVYRSSMVGEYTPVWCVNRPIADGSGVILIQPGGENLLRFDLSTGAVTHRRPLAFVGDPRCVLRVGSWLCFPSPQRMSFIPVENIEVGDVVSSIDFTPGSLKGRPIATDRMLLVPTASGLVSIDPATPKDAAILSLSPAGNTIIVDGTILVTDQTRLHLFVDPDRASQTLQARAARFPDAPLPQIELVDLAFRALRYDQILPPIDRALSLISAQVPDTTRDLRRRLFVSLSTIVRRALGESASTPASSSATPKPRAPIGLDPPMNIALVTAIVDRLASCAVTPQERVEHLLLAARADESRTDGAASMGRYHSILSDPILASVTLPGADYTLTSAEKIATDRMFNVLARFGASTYAAQDQAAAAELSQLGGESAASTQALSALLAKYPAASSAPSMHKALAERRAAAGDGYGAITALADAAHISRLGVAAGRADQAQVADDLALDVAAALAAQDRPAQAMATLAAIDAAVARGPLASKFATVRSRVDAALTQSARPAILGDRPDQGVQVLAGWIMLDGMPLLQNPSGPSIEHRVLFNDTLSRIGLFSITPRGTFEKLWDKPYDGIRPTILRVDHLRVLIFAPSSTGGTVECLDAMRGTSLWKSTDIVTWFDGLERKRTESEGPLQVVTPQDGNQRPGDPLFFGDEATLVMAQRGGRFAAIDLATGQRAWAAWPRIDVIFDATLVGSNQGRTIVAIGRRRGVDRTSDPISTLVTLDAQSGKILHEVDERTGWFDGRANPDEVGDIRWVRPISQGRVVLGMSFGIMCADPRTGTQLWRIADPQLGQSTDAWPLDASMVVLARDRALWLIDIEKGTRAEKSLERRGKVGELASMTVYPLIQPGNPRAGFVVATERGVLCYDRVGQLIGADALDGETTVLLPGISANRMVAVESHREEINEPGIMRDQTREAARMHLYETPSLRLKSQPLLVMYDDPRTMAILDGKLLVSTSSLTLVVSFPTTK